MPAEPLHDASEILREMQQATGLGPAKYLDRWRRGVLPDSFRNSAWLNIARAAIDDSQSDDDHGR